MVAVDVSSGTSGESNEGGSGGMPEGSESKTLAENYSDKGVLREGVRGSEVLDGGSITESVTEAGGKESVESGRLEINDKHGVGKNQAGDATSRSNRWDSWESWGVMNMVERVLGGNFGMDDEVEDLNASGNGRGGNVAGDACAWQGVLAEPTSVDNSEVDIEKLALGDVYASEIGREVNVVADRDAWQGVVAEPTSVGNSEVDIEKVALGDVNASEIGREVNVVADRDTCEGVTREPTSVNKSEVERIFVKEVTLEDIYNSKIGCGADVVVDTYAYQGVIGVPTPVNKRDVERIGVEKKTLEDVSTSKIGSKDACQGMIGEPIYVNKNSDTERLVDDKDSNDFMFDNLIEGGNLNGEKYLVSLIDGTVINGEEDLDIPVEGTSLYEEKYLVGLVEGTGLNGVIGLDGLVDETGLNGEKDLVGLVEGTGLNGEKYLDGLVKGTGLNVEEDSDGLVDETGLNVEKDLDGLVDETGLNVEKDLVGFVEGTGLNGEKDSDGLVKGTGLDGKKALDGLVDETCLYVEKDLVGLVERISLNGEKYLDCLVEGTGLNGEKDLDGLVKGTGLDGEKDSDDLVSGSGLNREKDSDDLVEGTGLKGRIDSTYNEVVPGGIVESDELNDVEVDTFLVPKTRGDHKLAEKEGEYYVSDLVWGKVKSHPWWPGQIFPPIAASDKAAKYIRKRCYLIAYFGDQSFAWNEGSNIKPFRKYFSQMEKQSNSDGFFHAVSCALDEIARRVEFGLSCPCLSEEVRDKVKLQVISNAGIWKERNVIDGGDNLSGVASFSPGRLVQFLESAAGWPQYKTDRLQFTIAKAQLLAFNRWKGYYELPVVEQYAGLLQDDTRVTVKGEEEKEFLSKKRKSTARDGHSTKHRRLSGEKESTMFKEKSISTLMSSSASIFPSVDEKPVKRARKRKPISSGKNSEGSNSVPSNSKVKRWKGLLPASPVGGGEESELVEIISAEIPTPDVILSKVILSAKVPMQGFIVMISELDFLREFRKLICLETKSKSGCLVDSGNEKGKQPAKLETAANTSGLEGTEDSYWTDRIIQGYTQEQVLLEPKNPDDKAAHLQEVNNKQKDVMALDSKNPLDESQPTALILNFSNLDNIPSVPNLNEIFNRYGPVKESETRILRKSRRAKLIFKRRADAETAFSSSGKYSIFGPSLLSYRLNYAPTPSKSRGASKRTKKGASSKVDA